MYNLLPDLKKVLSLDNRREQKMCQICYSAAAATDVHISGTGAKVTTIVRTI